MKITELKIGDKVCNSSNGFPMIVVGLYSSLDDLSNGTIYLDFEGNEGGQVGGRSKRLATI